MAERIAIIVIVSMVGTLTLAIYHDSWWSFLGLCAAFAFSIIVALLGE